MADKSKIEWTDATWNPITGCTRVSKGCENCYAERLAATRLRNHPSRRELTDRNGRWNGQVRFNEQWLDQPLRWRKPRRVFVVAHGDLFHEHVPDSMIDLVFAVMALAPQHTFQVLTKRAARMRNYLAASDVAERVEEVMAKYWTPLAQWPLPNVWIGVSVEDQRTADERLPLLYDTPTHHVVWLSLEPLLGPIDLTDHFRPDWVVVGGESGPYFRWMDPDWARDLRDHCQEEGIPFFLKQMAGKMPIPKDLMIREWPRVHHG